MVQITAEIDKQDLPHVIPGTFAIVTVPVGSRADAPTVPETAVRPSEQGFLVYVLSEDKGTAHATVIEIGLRTADGRIEVRSGLKPGDEIVVRGAESLRDGVPVVQGATPPDGAQP
jgi:multidrug efflux system membrane fusion protein